jgi:hypothetical protein
MKLPLADVPRLLAAVRPERLVRLDISARDIPQSNMATSDLPLQHLQAMEAALTAAAPRLRPSCHIALNLTLPLRPETPREVTATVAALLSRRAEWVDQLHLVVAAHEVEEPPAWLARETKEGGLLHESNAFLPALRSLRLPETANDPDAPLSSVPALRDHLESLIITPARHTSGLHVDGSCAESLRRLRSLAYLREGPHCAKRLLLDARLTRLSTLTSLEVNLGAVTKIQLEDPRAWFDGDPAMLFAHLEAACFLTSYVDHAPPFESLARLLPALHHVTRLHMSNAPLVDRNMLSPLSNLRDLCLDRVTLNGSADSLFGLSLPAALSRLFLSFSVMQFNPMVTVPAALLTHQTALKS